MYDVTVNWSSTVCTTEVEEDDRLHETHSDYVVLQYHHCVTNLRSWHMYNFLLLHYTLYYYYYYY